MNPRKEIEVYRFSGSQTTDSEALRLSKIVFSVLSADLQSKNEVKQYAYSVFERALNNNNKEAEAPTSPRPVDTSAATPDDRSRDISNGIYKNQR